MWKSNGQVSGPGVRPAPNLGGSTSFDLGDETYRRQALIWYVLRATLDRFVQEDPWFVLKGKTQRSTADMLVAHRQPSIFVSCLTSEGTTTAAGDRAPRHGHLHH